MTTLLKEYYLSDFNNFFSFRVDNWTLFENGVEKAFLASVHFSLTDKKAFLSYYLPKFENEISVISHLINIHQENMNKIFFQNPDIESIKDSKDDGSDEKIYYPKEFIFTGEIIFYYEGTINEIGFSDLKTQCLAHNITIKHFDFKYLESKNVSKEKVPTLVKVPQSKIPITNIFDQTKLELIKELKIIESNKYTIDELKEKLGGLINGYQISINPIHLGTTLYRGITYESKPTNFSFLGCPPPNFAKMNRASREGISMFYCASDKKIPLFELKAETNLKLVISKWSTQKEMFFNHIGYTNHTFNKLGANRENPKYFPNELNKYNEALDNIFSHLFSLDIVDNEYNLTIAIAELFLNCRDFAGLQYPTIPMRANGDNVVIKEEFIKNGFLKFEEVEYIEVLHYNSDTMEYKIKVIDIANEVDENGKILWKNIDSSYLWTPDIQEITIKNKDGFWDIKP